MKMRMLAGALLAAGFAFGAQAQDVKIGLSAEPSALDPHYHNLGPNNQLAVHIFDTLILQDDDQKLVPGLATSWKPVDDTTWEFKLRQGVKFHDGSPFTAEDVIYSLNRVPKVPNAPSPFTIFTRPIAEAKVVDAQTIRFTTAQPYPLLPNDMSRVAIVSSKAMAGGTAAEGKTTEQLNRGDGLVGTGPYKFAEWVRGDRLVLSGNPDYWGAKPRWQKVTYRPISNNAARVAALLAGDVDAIENPPTADLAKLRQNANVVVTEKPSNRVIYIHLDSFRDDTPGIPEAKGKNPLKDAKVREALSMAINREAIVGRIMEGLGVAAGNLLPTPMFGSSPDLKPTKFDAEGAKRQLAAAGYPNGFSITLGTPNDRYINDAEVAQAVAAMWTRAGVKTSVEASTRTVFFKNRDDFKYSAYLAGWGAGTGEMSDPLRALLATQDKDKGMGGTNKGRYSNPKMDAALQEALRTVDDTKRETLLQQASKLAMEDYGLLPLHYEVSPWAARKGLRYIPRADQYTLADNLRTQ